VPFKSVEHIVPKELGNKELTLKGIVCDLCNGRFGGALDSVFTQGKGKGAFLDQSSKITFLGTEITAPELEKRAKNVMERESKRAAEGDERDGTMILSGTSGDNPESRGGVMADLFANDPFAKYGARGLFAAAKIAIEYIYYIRKDAASDQYFKQICSALHTLAIQCTTRLKLLKIRFFFIFGLGVQLVQPATSNFE